MKATNQKETETTELYWILRVLCYLKFSIQ